MKAAKVKFLIALLLLLPVGGVLFAGGGVQGPDDVQSTAVPEGMNSWEVDTSPVTLTLFMDGPRSFIQRCWGRDPVSQKWIKDTGVDIEWTFAPDESGKAYNLLIASGDFPDMISASGNLPQNKQLAENGLIWDLQELSEKYAPGFWEFNWKWNKKSILAMRIAFESMGFYQSLGTHLPDKYMDSPYILFNATGLTVIDKIYEAVGSPTIESGEDYLNMLRAVQRQFPELTPMQSMRAASPVADGSPRLVDNLRPHSGLAEKYYEIGGKWRRYWEHPNFIKLLKYANTLYNEGLINPTEFTDKKADLKARISAGKIFSELSQDSDNLEQWNTRIQKNHPDWEFNFIKPFVLDPATMTYKSDTLGGGIGGGRNMVTTQSQHPDRAIRWLDYIQQEQPQKEIFYGIEGHGHVMKDGLPYYTPEGAAALEAGEEVHQDQFGMGAYWIFRDDYWQKVAKTVEAPDIVKKAMDITNASYSDLSFYMAADNFATDSEELKIWAVMKDYYQTEILKVISADPSDVESKWNTLLAKMRELGLEKLDDFWTSHFNNKTELEAKYSADM